MTKTIEFTRDTANQYAVAIFEHFHRSEDCFKAGDLERNIRNVCGYSELLRNLRFFGAEVDAMGIYDDNGFDRIGYGSINGHVIVKNGRLDGNELQAALYEIADAE